MPNNTWWSAKYGAKLLFVLVTFLIFSLDVPLDFYKSVGVVQLKYITYFLAGIKTK